MTNEQKKIITDKLFTNLKDTILDDANIKLIKTTVETYCMWMNELRQQNIVTKKPLVKKK